MELFRFELDKSKLDERSVFANMVLKLIVQKNNFDLDAAIKESKPFFVCFDDLIRNIYELIDTEIPLYSYYNLMTLGADNHGLNEIEFLTAIKNAKDACKLYYC